MGVLGVLAVQVVWIFLGSILMIAQVQWRPNFTAEALLWLVDIGLLGTALPIVLIALLVRREVRRAEFISPSAAPNWMPRAVLLTVLFAIATQVPAVAPASSDVVSFTSVGLGGFLIVLVLALLTRSRIWRAISIAVLTTLLTTGGVGLCFFLVLSAQHRLPMEMWQPVDPFHAVFLAAGTQLLGLFCCAMGLIALLSPSARAAFGLPPRKSRNPHAAAAPVHA
jgi:hypothetical protein